MIQHPRKKKRKLLLSFIYRSSKLFFFLSVKTRLRLFSDLEWIFERLALEESNKYYKKTHPHPSSIVEFVKPYLKPDFSICDIGCKYGLISAMLAQQVKKVVAVDSDPNAISIAQKLYHGNNLQFICSEGTEYLKSNSGKFDMIVLSHILEHIDNPVEFLQKNIPCTNLIFIEVPDIEKSFLNQYRLDTGSSLTYSDQDHIFEFDRVYLMNLFGELHLEIANSEYKYGVQRYLLKTNTH